MKNMKIGLMFLGIISLAVGSLYLFNKVNNDNNYPSMAGVGSYSFTFDKDNAPTLTGADKEQKEVIATGLNNNLYLTYSHASNLLDAHAALAINGFISNYEPIKGIKSLTIIGSGSFKIGYGIEAITDYKYFDLDDSSYILDEVDMNYFKLVALSNNAIVNSIYGIDDCSSAEFGVRQYSDTSARYTDKWTRLIHDVPSTQAFTYNISWTQNELDSSKNNYNPKIILLDADALYDLEDNCVTVGDNAGFACRAVQFGQERTVMNYKNASTAGNNVANDTASGGSKGGVIDSFVDTNGSIFTTGLIDDASHKPIGTGASQAGLGWSVLRKGCTVNVSITYTPNKGCLNECEVVWNIRKTVNKVDWSFTMTQRARFNNISNLALAAGSPKCEWTILSTSSSGLHDEDIIVDENSKYRSFEQQNEELKDENGQSYLGYYTFERTNKTIMGQGGTIYNDKLYVGSNSGMMQVKDFETNTLLASLTLDKSVELQGGYSVKQPHNNAVGYAPKENSEYPYIYTNCYSDLQNHLGTLCVYSFDEVDNGVGISYTSDLVQIIKIGFLDNPIWASSGGAALDNRPYGNFAIDYENGYLYAIALKQGDEVTTIIKFNLPAINEGVYNDTYEANVLTLEVEDVIEYFDAPYAYSIQDVDFYNNCIFITEGFTNNVNEPARMRVIDVINKCQVALFEIHLDFFPIEPEFICWYEGELYYSDAKLNVLKMKLR